MSIHTPVDFVWKAELLECNNHLLDLALLKLESMLAQINVVARL